ncbi:2-dehydro-3-deoxygalactonokinase [Rhizobium oryzicola]|uniref:2-dehydro-3-deoxygalactonokinase n=1 Tax=Rhizobium oryzicola TaxID=1232668 RepID=A0ABT8SS89_9HYPH|nr:2-dehydro-3-deoxygalactonokinase [Rhizobium oryzicola]MDO1581191.1 2-dehydro-3-deoxygalactonokinase [Rhizobium oryzicola]
MTQPAYVAVDWGTSSFRVWLMDAEDKVLAERRSGEGMTTAATVGFNKVLGAHLQELQAPAELPVIVCGMAGARQGWVEAGYVDAPARLSAVLSGAVNVPSAAWTVKILPGIAQRAQDAPDVMRGEETQLLGALGPGASGERVVCMPGTHSKWVNVSGDKVSGFSTFMTGELFDVISKNSILKHTIEGAERFDGSHPAFRQAVLTARQKPQMLTNLFFTVRSGQLLHGLDSTSAAARLSGTLIGAEMAGGLANAGADTHIHLVASGSLQALYEAAFQALGLAFETIDADVAVRGGLAAAAQSLFFSDARTSA